MGQVDYPANTSSKASIEKAVDEFLPDKLYDIWWKKIFHYETFFDSIDGTTNSGTTLNAAGATFTTGATSGNFAEIAKAPTPQGLITFSQPSRIRSAVNLSQITDQTIYIVTGGIGATDARYGFKIVNAVLSGVTNVSGGTETLVTLATLASGQNYNIEARYIPNIGVSFYVDDPTTSPATSIREVSRITSNLPSANAVSRTDLMYIRITTNAAAAKTMTMAFFEYLQRRNILK